MALSFDGTDDVISLTGFTAITSTDYSIVCWLKIASKGEASGTDPARILYPDQTTFTQFGVTNPSGSDVSIRAYHPHSTTAAQSNGSTALTTGVWLVLATTYRASDKTLRLYQASRAAAATELAYGTQTAGVGTRTNTSANPMIGNSQAGDRTLHGVLAHLCVHTRELATWELDQFRNGIIPLHGLRNYWSFNTTQANDLVGGVTAGVTGAVAAEGPPVAMTFPGGQVVAA